MAFVMCYNELVKQTETGRFLFYSAGGFNSTNSYWVKRPLLSDFRPAVCLTPSADNKGRFVMKFIDRFWKKVNIKQTDECWPWTASLDSKGYGQIFRIVGGKRKNLRAHRVSYELRNGKISSGRCVLHKCDNPACVNPSHLFVGTMKDNTRDMIKKGRNGFGQFPGSSNPSSKFTETDVKKIRQWYHNNQKSMSEMALEYGVTYQAIWYIIKKGWKHVR